jgi:hypothetical protein
MRKRCPICDSTEWDYDVVSDLGRFCGGCYWELKRFAKDHGLTRYNLNYGQTMIVSPLMSVEGLALFIRQGKG